MSIQRAHLMILEMPDIFLMISDDFGDAGYLFEPESDTEPER